MEEKDRLAELNVRNEIVTNDSRSATQSAILINGGAVAALLAFLTNLSSSSRLQLDIGSIRIALLLFALGVAVASICTATTYLTNFSYLAQAQAYFKTDIETADRSLQFGRSMHWLSVILFTASVLLFISGVCISADAIR